VEIGNQETNIIRTERKLTCKEKDGSKNQSRLSAASASWVELLKLSGRRWPFIYEDVGHILVHARSRRNSVKILELWTRFNPLSLSNFVGFAAGELLKFFAPTARPIDDQSFDFALLSQTESDRQFRLRQIA
jgi:hypothetical protein